MRTRDPLVQMLMGRWSAFSERCTAAMRGRDAMLQFKDTESQPFNLTEENLRAVIVNDQFGLAVQLSLTHAIEGLQKLQRVVLPPRFNFREFGHGEGADIVVDHSSRRKEEAVTAHLRGKVYIKSTFQFAPRRAPREEP